jgi:hypothetical protein
MAWLILFLVIFVIVASIADFSCSSWNFSKQFFTDSWWGIIAVITGFIAFLLFYASGKSYKDVKINESFLPNINKLNQNNETTKGKRFMSLIKKDSADVVEFDLSKLTMDALVKKMAYEMTKPGPVFFKGWGNRRLMLDVERVKIIKSYIDSIVDTGKSLMDLQSDAFLSFEKINSLVEEKRYQLKERVQLSKNSYNFAKEEYVHKIEMMKLQRDSLEEDIKTKRAQREQIEMENLVGKLRGEAEYKLIMAKGTKEEEIAKILKEAVIYFKDLPNVLKSYVTVQLGSENAQNPDSDLELKDKLKEYIMRKHDAEAKMLENEVDEKKALTDTLKVKLDREKKKLKGDGKV